MTLPLLLVLPWALFAAVFWLRLEWPRPLPARADVRSDAPLVSVIVPARNEAHNIGRLLETVTESEYPRFEVIVVDDRSDDGTADLARAHAPGNAERIEVIEAGPLPEGWMGKPWACTAGFEHARGEVLLFTDADTVHAPTLLARTVSAFEEERADALSLLGDQVCASFWERLVQPQVFAMLFMRFPKLRDPLPQRRWRDAIANGQYLMFRRSSYEALGGHEAVRSDVAEDLRLAQLVVKRGDRLVFREAREAFSTHMYRGLREIVMGWSKNTFIGGQQSLPPAIRPLMAPLSLATGATLWLVPPAALLAAGVGLAGPAVRVWSLGAVLVSVIFWSHWSFRSHGSGRYGLLYPVGAAVALWIVLRSALRGSRVEWKGREYRAVVRE